MALAIIFPTCVDLTGVFIQKRCKDKTTKRMIRKIWYMVCLDFREDNWYGVTDKAYYLD